jgi:META domain
LIEFAGGSGNAAARCVLVLSISAAGWRNAEQRAGRWHAAGGLDFFSAIRYPLTRFCHLHPHFCIRYSETTMLSLRRRCGFCLVLGLFAATPFAAVAGDAGFPFGDALVLDAAPLPGSKRVPMIEIEESGDVSFYLWCASVRGSAKVGDGTITIVPTTPMPSQCTPDQISRDAGLLAQLSQMTGWRRKGDEVDLLGADTLRFRLMTN